MLLPRRSIAVVLALLLALVGGWVWYAEQEANASGPIDLGSVSAPDGDHDGDPAEDHGGSSSAQEEVSGEEDDQERADSVNEDNPLAVDCSGSDLPPHTGFQSPTPVCVDTEFGEQSAQENNPQLLIVDAPKNVRAGQDIVLKVSTRNLIRDRFLPAGGGGYYLETSLLTDGIQRGHFHAACRPLASENAAPQPERSPVFFAVEDGGGGRGADTVTVTLAGGLAEIGPAQCAAWAGDGSHRIPMMAFANQVPAFDAVRVNVRGGQGNGH